MQEEKICPHCGFGNTYTRDTCIECGRNINEKIDPKTWTAPVMTKAIQRGPFSLSAWSSGAFVAVIILLLLRLFLVIGQQVTERLRTFLDLQKGIEIVNALALFALALGLFSVVMDTVSWLGKN